MKSSRRKMISISTPNLDVFSSKTTRQLVDNFLAHEYKGWRERIDQENKQIKVSHED